MKCNAVYTVCFEDEPISKLFFNLSFSINQRINLHFISDPKRTCNSILCGKGGKWAAHTIFYHAPDASIEKVMQGSMQQ